MKKKFFKFVLFLMLVFSIIAIAGCNDASSVTSTNGDIATPYTIYNRSSYTVTLWDATGTVTLESGQKLEVFFNNINSIHDVRYAPADKVKVVGSGLVYELLDK